MNYLDHQGHDVRPYRATVRCTACGHPDHWHRHDDTDNTALTDPACRFRCVGYDCEADGSLTRARATYRTAGDPPFCACLDMVRP